MRDNMAADKNNEPWTKLEKRYKEYRNPVLVLTHGLQTRLCCRFVENNDLKEWHWLGSQDSQGQPDSCPWRVPRGAGQRWFQLTQDWLQLSQAPAPLPQHGWCLMEGTWPGRDCGSEGWRRPCCS